MINCSFLPVFYEHHQSVKGGIAPPAYEDFGRVENIWLGFYGLGKFETYRFVYEQCASLDHLQQWLLDLKGEERLAASAAAFEAWTRQRSIPVNAVLTATPLLDEAQWHHWRQQGYIRVSGVVPEALCDAVCALICEHLGADLQAPETWYSSHPDWHGLMLQLYQHESIHAIRALPAVQQLFVELYGTSHIIANTDKVSFNPPETDAWQFRHQRLHWDIDFSKIDHDYIQGLVYLNDVPDNRGPLQVVPGFHHRFDDWMASYPDPDEAQLMMEQTFTGEPVPGEKGDIILWLQTLPHTASANRSGLPRFVQYLSFSKC